MLRINPGFAAAATLILGMGMAANTVIFSVVDALVLRPLPYTDSERLVLILEGNDQLKAWGPASFLNYQDWKAQSQLSERMAAFLPGAVNFSGMGEPERLKSIRVTADLIPLLNLRLQIGRPFSSGEYEPGKDLVAILGHGLWQRRFGARTDIAGHTLMIGGQPHTVAGVMAPSARMGLLLGFEPELWLPLTPRQPADRGFRCLGVIARLKQGVTIDQAQSELTVIARRLESQYPETNREWKALLSNLRGSVDPAAYAFLALLIASILGIACTNVANLLLARSAGRQKEMAIRSALGAGRRRLVRQLMTESLLLALMGCCLGMPVAILSCELIRIFSAGTNLAVVDVRPDARILGLTLLLFIATGVAAGLIPVIRMFKLDLSQSLKEGRSGSNGGTVRNRLGNLLLAAEVMLSLTLLVGGGVAIKSWFRLWNVDPGFRRENIMTASLSLSDAKYPDGDRRIAFFQELLSKLDARAEIESAGLCSAPPTMGPRTPFAIQTRPRPLPGTEPLARYTAASPGYFRTLIIPLRAGRMFTERDDAAALPVALINETMARRYWNGENPLGGQIEVRGKVRTIVGIMGDFRNAPLAIKPQPEIYVPILQSPEPQVMLAVATSAENPLSTAAVLKREVQAIDPAQPVDRLEMLEKILSKDMGVITLGSRILVILGLGAMLLAAVGVYGVLSYSVSRRAREFGIRMALGARQSDVLGLVLWQATKLALLGVVPGLGLSFLLVAALSKSLYGVNSVEPVIIVGLSLLLTAVALAAGYVPARHATRVDPMGALRCE